MCPVIGAQGVEVMDLVGENTGQVGCTGKVDSVDQVASDNEKGKDEKAGLSGAAQKSSGNLKKVGTISNNSFKSRQLQGSQRPRQKMSMANLGRMHDLSGKPWIFRGDPTMEVEYQADLIEGTLSRLRPMCYFIIPLGWVWKISLLLSQVVVPRPWPQAEVAASLLKVALLLGFTVLCARHWNEELKCRLGRLLIWMNRVFGLIIILQEAGLYAPNDTQIMFLLVLEMILGAAITPTFCEYMTFSVVFAITKPAAILAGSRAHAHLGVMHPDQAIYPLGPLYVRASPATHVFPLGGSWRFWRSMLCSSLSLLESITAFTGTDVR